MTKKDVATLVKNLLERDDVVVAESYGVCVLTNENTNAAYLFIDLELCKKEIKENERL